MNRCLHTQEDCPSALTAQSMPWPIGVRNETYAWRIGAAPPSIAVASGRNLVENNNQRPLAFIFCLGDLEINGIHVEAVLFSCVKGIGSRIGVACAWVPYSRRVHVTTNSGSRLALSE